MSFIWAALAGLASGVLGAMGMGGGGVLIIYLTLFAGLEQGVAQGINLIFFIPGALIALAFYWKKKLVDWKLALPCALLGVCGALAGSYLSTVIDGRILGKLFGGLLLLMGLKQIFGKAPKADTKSSSNKSKSTEK